jgi:hypothetical protein
MQRREETSLSLAPNTSWPSHKAYFTHLSPARSIMQEGAQDPPILGDAGQGIATNVGVGRIAGLQDTAG